MEAFTFNVVVNGETVLENAVTADLDIVRIDESHYHVLLDHQSYEARLLNVDYQTKTFHFNINGGHYEVKLADKFDQVVNRLGLTVHSAVRVKDIKAPMPGLVLELQVEPGQTVAKGDPLLILEAMKMENVLRAPGDAVIKAVKVNKGAAVEKNQILIELE